MMILLVSRKIMTQFKRDTLDWISCLQVTDILYTG